MELTASAVNWQNFLEVVGNGLLSDILFEEIEYNKELVLDGTPWFSDSAIEYMNAAEHIVDLAKSNEYLKVISNELMCVDFQFPCDLECDFDPEQIAGALSSESVKRYSLIFDKLDMSGLDDSIIEYLNQWKIMLKFCCERNAGVYFHLG